VTRSVSATVLIAEDTTLLRELMGGVVRGLPGYRLIADTATCAAAVAACREHRPDLVIFGWHFSDGPGCTLLKTLVTELPATRWLALLPHPSGRAVHEAISHGAQACVMQQSGLSSLREAILRLGSGGTFYCSISARLLLESIRQQSGSRADHLTEREREVLRYFAAGANPKRIGALLNTSAKTVQNQLSHIRQKLGVESTAGLVRYALHAGLD
jgi:Response regulator containing a CheY-like receiver domain and an HTH DNA-binding domain